MTLDPKEVGGLVKGMRLKAAVLETRGKNNTLHDVCQSADYLLEAATALEAQAAETRKYKNRWKAKSHAYEAERAAHAETKRERDEALKALEPFSDMAGEMFARGWDASNVAIALDNPDEPHRVTAGDFFAARRALTGGHEDGQ